MHSRATISPGPVDGRKVPVINGGVAWPPSVPVTTVCWRWLTACTCGEVSNLALEYADEGVASNFDSYDVIVSGAAQNCMLHSIWYWKDRRMCNMLVIHPTKHSLEAAKPKPLPAASNTTCHRVASDTCKWHKDFSQSNILVTSHYLSEW